MMMMMMVIMSSFGLSITVVVTIHSLFFTEENSRFQIPFDKSWLCRSLFYNFQLILRCCCNLPQIFFTNKMLFTFQWAPCCPVAVSVTTETQWKIRQTFIAKLCTIIVFETVFTKQSLLKCY